MSGLGRSSSIIAPSWPRGWASTWCWCWSSTLVAAAIGIPFGIVAARRPSLARPIVAIANLAQTIPSLALFGFLIPLPFVGGIGTRAALVALTRVCGAADPAQHHHRHSRRARRRRRMRGGHGTDAATGAAPGRVAAGAAVDRVGPSRGGGDRRRHGDHRLGDRRRRARRLHLSRAGDGRCHRDPGRRVAGGVAGHRRRRRAGAGRPRGRSAAPHASRPRPRRSPSSCCCRPGRPGPGREAPRAAT